MPIWRTVAEWCVPSSVFDGFARESERAARLAGLDRAYFQLKYMVNVPVVERVEW